MPDDEFADIQAQIDRLNSERRNAPPELEVVLEQALACAYIARELNKMNQLKK